MNLAQVVQYIKNIALEHPLVKSFYEGDPTVYLNSKEIKYGAFIITQQAFNNVVKEQGIKKYTFNCTYADRLTEDGSNRLVVQTDGINVIHEVFNYIKGNSETSNVPLPITFSTFEQKFADSLAGSFATITLEVEDETGDCDFYYEDILIEPIPGTSHTTVLDNYYTKVEVDDLIRDIEYNIEHNLEHNQLRGRNDDPLFQHVNEEQKALITSTAEIVSGHTEDISDLQTNKQDKLIAGDNIVISDNVISADLNVDLSAYLTIDEASNTYETIENVQTLSDIVSGHTGDIESLEENKADKVISLINVDNSPIDDTFILYNLTQMNVLGELGNDTNITFVLPAPIQDTVNESIVHFTTNESGIPTFIYNNFVPLFESEKPIEMNINKSYTICFEQLYNGQEWIVKTTWGEF